MADFKISIQKTLLNEGGYQNEPNDSGNWYNGINYGTKWGITSRDVALYFPSLISDLNCVRNLTEEQAITIYREGYWKPLYSQINDQDVADKLFDMGVLFGVGTAAKMLQLTLAATIVIVSDGIFGPQTLDDLNQVNPADFLINYRHTLINHCLKIVTDNPKDGEFAHGWIARISR